MDSFVLHLSVDDGAVIYLNGSEIVRTNMPSGTISGTTLANASPARMKMPLLLLQ